MRESGEDPAYTDAVVDFLGYVDYEDLFDYNDDGVIESDDVLDFVANVAGWWAFPGSKNESQEWHSFSIKQEEDA